MAESEMNPAQVGLEIADGGISGWWGAWRCGGWLRVLLVRGGGLVVGALMGLVVAGVALAEEGGGFPKPQVDFGEHRVEVFEYIRGRSLGGRGVGDIERNLPFEVKAEAGVAYRGRFLLFHGLSDSAFVWADMARSLAGLGFDVRAVLLPGHGSHPDEMLEVSYREWLEAARAHYRIWRGEGGTPIYLGGFSLGGVIATILAVEEEGVAGLLLFSPAFASRRDAALRWAWLYAKFRPYMFGGLILEDNPIKYNSIPINSLAQYHKTKRYLLRRLRGARLTMPVLMVASWEDSVVDVGRVREIFHKRFGHAGRTLLLYAAGGEVPALRGRKGGREVVRRSAYPELRILNQSHLSVANSPGNLLFGAAAEVLVCNGNEYPIFMACMTSPRHWYGAQNTLSPDGVAVARTTYNPDYRGVVELIAEVFL